MGFDSSHTNFHSIEEVVLTCLKQHEQRHACGAQEREIMESLNILRHRFSSLLDHCKELVHCYLDIILVEWEEKPSFQVNPDGAAGQAPKPIRGHPFKGANEKSSCDGIIINYIIGLRSEVIDMLVG